MFLVLGLLVTPTTLVDYIVPGIVVALVLTLVARPLAVALCLAPFGFNRREIGFVSWVGLRGAVSIFLATIPTLAGVPHAAAFFNIAFFVVLTSLLVQGWTVTGLARRLGFALRRTTPTVTRVELDLPGQIEQELVGYPVTPDSMVLGLSRLPSWTRLIMVIRDSEVLEPQQAGAVQAGDYAYLLSPPDRVSRLDRLFSETEDLARRGEARPGELSINGDADVGAVADLYDLTVAPEQRDLRVADYLAMRLPGPPQPGQRSLIGRATLVVRSLEDGRVVRAGLWLDDMVEALIAGRLAPRPRLVQWLQATALRLHQVRPQRDSTPFGTRDGPQ